MAPRLARRLTTISHVVTVFSQTTWSPAHPEQLVEFWETGLQHILSFAVLGLAVLVLRLMSNAGKRPPAENALGLRTHESMAGLLFLLIPLLAIAGGLMVTHMFTARYALLGLTGVLLLIPMVASRLAEGRAMAGFLFLCVSMVPLMFAVIEVPPRENPFTQEPLLVKALEDGPVAVADGQLFIQMWYYSPDRLKPRIVYLADNQAAVKYMGFDAIDGGLRILKPWASVAVEEYKDFATPGRTFSVYQNSLRPGWLLARIVADGDAAELTQDATFRQLYRVRIKP